MPELTTPTIYAYLTADPTYAYISDEIAQLAESHAELIETALIALYRIMPDQSTISALITSMLDNCADLAFDELFADTAYPATMPTMPPIPDEMTHDA